MDMIEKITKELHEKLPYTKGRTTITKSDDGVYLYTQLPFGFNYDKVIEIMDFLDSYNYFNSKTACMPTDKYSIGDGFVTVGKSLTGV